MTIDQMKNKVKIDSLVKTIYGWKYVCFITEDGVRATERIDDMSPYPPFYPWKSIFDVRN
jgi:hypothetical protein